MAKRIGWKVSAAAGGKVAVVEVLEGDTVADGLIVFPTREEAQKFIDYVTRIKLATSE